jgi:hypothetical protein
MHLRGWPESVGDVSRVGVGVPGERNAAIACASHARVEHSGAG